MTTNWFFKLSFLLCMVATACSSDDSKQQAPPVFPEKQMLSVEAGQTLEIQFDAAQEWRMASDKSWLRFLIGESQEELAIASGDAGKNTLTILMKENGWGFDAESALLSLTMSNLTQVVYEVTRPAIIREVRMKYAKSVSGTPKEAESLTIAYNEFTMCRIGFEANFDWKIRSMPEWMKPIRTAGDANVVLSSNKMLDIVSIDLAMKPYEKNGVIVISDRLENQTFEFPVTYAGMPGNTIAVSPGSILRSGLTFTHDGRIYKTGTEGSGSTEERESVIKVESRNMQCRIAVVAYDSQSNTAQEVTGAESWVSCVESPLTKAEYTISVNADNKTAADRKLYLYILPPDYMSGAGYDYAKDFDDDWFSSKLGMCITQQVKPLSEGFVITAAVTNTPMAAPQKLNDPALQAEYGTENIYQKVFTPEEWAISGAIKVVPNGIEFFSHLFANSGKWATKWESTGAALMISNRVSYASLPTDRAPIIFKTSGGAIHGVLFIAKQ